MVASATLILCSCRQGDQLITGARSQSPVGAAASYGPQTLPPAAFSGLMPQPYDPDQPWSPPGIRGPWPADEYIHDGGDRGGDVKVTEDFGIHNLELGGTIAHFDTVDGRRIAQASNKVYIYAPRFAAVRHVRAVQGNRHRLRVADYHKPTKLNVQQEDRLAATAIQRRQTERQIVAIPPVVGESTALVDGVSIVQNATAYQDRIKPSEDFQVFSTVAFEQTQKAVLAKHIDAALTWTANEAVQIILDKKIASEISVGQRAEQTFRVKDITGEPTLRIVKLASVKTARPGEFVDFTIRFENTGNQPIGNVTIVDNLISRLEYVPDSQKCDIGADFLTEQNDGGTLVLRWEITAPLTKGQGGVIQFRCKVR